MADGNLERVTEFGSAGSTASIYDEWAATYHDDLLDEYGYNAPRTAVAALGGLTERRDLEVVDFGQVRRDEESFAEPYPLNLEVAVAQAHLLREWNDLLPGRRQLCAQQLG